MTLIEEIRTLVGQIEALPKEQKEDILSLAPTMSEDELNNMKNLLAQYKDADLIEAEAELTLWRLIAAEYRGLHSAQRKEEEAKSHAADEAEAENLLSNL